MMRVKYSFVKNVLQSIYICCFIKKKISKLLVASMVGFKYAYTVEFVYNEQACNEIRLIAK